jgi:hypothetical protein
MISDCEKVGLYLDTGPCPNFNAPFPNNFHAGYGIENSSAYAAPLLEFLRVES